MAEYFSHDYDAREDEKIQELIFKLNMEGYGIYWSIIEMLYKNDGYMQMECERIAFALHTDKDKVNSVIHDFNLFKVNGNAFTSTSVLHRLKLRKGKSATARKAAKIRWGKENADDANAMQTQCKRNAKKKRKESKEKESKENKIALPWIEDEFYHVWEFWKKYKREQHNFSYKPIGEQGALSKLQELSGGDLAIALLIIKQSIQNGWKGLFELKERPQNQKYDIDEIIEKAKRNAS